MKLKLIAIIGLALGAVGGLSTSKSVQTGRQRQIDISKALRKI